MYLSLLGVRFIKTNNMLIIALVNLGLMAADHIPCDFPYFPIPYGCWCGITLPWPCPYKPVDDFDDLCKTHDYCYEEAEDSMGCSIWDEYLWLYKWHNGEDGEVRQIGVIFDRCST